MEFINKIIKAFLQSTTQPKVKVELPTPAPRSTKVKVKKVSKPLKRIIIHWTAGSYTASALDKEHYHFLIEGDGEVVEGNLPPSANLSTRTTYAAHTRRLNTGSIGVSLCAMAGAQYSPFRTGKYPITEAQVDSLGLLVARLCVEHGIPVTRETVLTHAEVQPTLKVKQNGKWDITWLPTLASRTPPLSVGDLIRGEVKRNLTSFELV